MKKNKKKAGARQAEILKSIKLLRVHEGHVIEVRGLGVPMRYGGPAIVSGYFDNHIKAAAAARELERRGATGVYITLNEIDPSLLARGHNRLVERPKATTADHDIIRRLWLPLDIDPKRPAGTSSSKEEVAIARGRSDEIANFLAADLAEPTIRAFSGNGHHLLLRTDMPTDDTSTQLVKDFIEIIANRFSDSRVSVDRTVHNPARIWRLYGTKARKGDEVPSQGLIHRRSKILATADTFVSAEQLRAFVQRHKTSGPKPTGSASRSAGIAASPQALQAYLESCGQSVKSVRQRPHGSSVLVLNTCPMNRDHGKQTDTAVVWRPSGNIGFECKHDGCADHTWVRVRDEIDPGWRERQRQPECPIGYQPFPIEVLPDGIRRYVEEAAAAMVCDPAFVAVPLLAALASAIGNSRRIRLKKSWTEPAVVWCGVCAESGTLKSPALDKAVVFVRELQTIAVAEHRDERKEYKREKERYEASKKAARESLDGDVPEKPEKPVLRRYYCHDITIEALADRLEHSPRGLLLVSEELASWVGGFERYGQGSNLTNWLSLHGARPLVVDRKTADKPTIYVPLASLSVTGTIQPGVLQRLFTDEYFDSGLAARVLIARPSRRRRRWTDADIRPLTTDAVRRTFAQLHQIEMEGEDEHAHPRDLPLNDEAKKVWVEFYGEHADEQHQLTGNLSSAWSKLESYAARFALIIRLARSAECKGHPRNVKKIDAESVHAGITLARWFGGETERVYSLFGRNESSPTQDRQLLDFIRNRGPVTARDITRGAKGINSVDEAERILKPLVDAGVVLADESKPGPAGGRPTVKYSLQDETPKSLSKNEVLARNGFVEELKAHARRRSGETKRPGKVKPRNGGKTKAKNRSTRKSGKKRPGNGKPSKGRTTKAKKTARRRNDA